MVLWELYAIPKPTINLKQLESWLFRPCHTLPFLYDPISDVMNWGVVLCLCFNNFHKSPQILTSQLNLQHKPQLLQHVQGHDFRTTTKRTLSYNRYLTVVIAMSHVKKIHQVTCHSWKFTSKLRNTCLVLSLSIAKSFAWAAGYHWILVGYFCHPPQ